VTELFFSADVAISSLNGQDLGATF